MTNCKKWTGWEGRDTTTWAGCNTRRTAATRPHAKSAFAPMPEKDAGTGWDEDGTLAPASSLPQGTRDPLGTDPRPGRIAPGARIAPGTGRARARGRSPSDEGATVAVLRGPGIRTAGPPGGGAGTSGVELRGSGS